MLQTKQLDLQDNRISAALREEATAGLAALKSAQPSDVLYLYLKMQIQMHQEAYMLVDSLTRVTSDNSFNEFVNDMRDTIADYREHAADRLRDLSRVGPEASYARFAPATADSFVITVRVGSEAAPQTRVFVFDPECETSPGF
jgi:hypothetical protein